MGVHDMSDFFQSLCDDFWEAANAARFLTMTMVLFAALLFVTFCILAAFVGAVSWVLS